MTNGEWFMATTTQPLEVKRNGTCIWLYFNNEENHYMLPTEWWDAKQTEPRFDKDINVRSKDEPQTCDTCRFELYCPEMCEGCCEWDSHYEPKDEVTISKMEQVEQRSCDTCKGRDIEGWKNPCLGCTGFAFYEPKDEPQYDIDKGTISCDNCAENGSYKCSKCDGEIYFKRLAVENEPQTEDEVLREQVRAFMGIVEQMKRSE